jgi:2-methylisoborneol synthase
LGTSAARIPRLEPSAGEAAAPVPDATWRIPGVPTGMGSAASRIVAPPPAESGSESGSGSELYCPPALRDDVALGESLNDDVVEWAERVGVYPGQLDRLRAANFGRLIMLTHPGSDDPDRLLAATKCIVAEWATDDHFLDEESLGADANTIGSRLGITYGALDPVDLPAKYAPQLDAALSDEPVSVAYRSAFEHLGQFATATQMARVRHELCCMFMAYNHEATWRRTGRVPPVWEYLTHRHENSFLPPMVLVDPVAGYELPASEFAERRVRRLFCLAGSASVILNDVYSMSKESDDDFDLPKLIVAEEDCSPEEAIERTVQIHNELMHTFEAEAIVLSQFASPALRRFLTDLWAWLGGNREWHSTTKRYRDA